MIYQFNFSKSLFGKTWVIFLTLNFVLFSQAFSNSSDSKLWTGLEIKKKLTSKTKLILGQQIILKNQFSDFDKTFTNISFSYKIIPLFEQISSFRYIIYHDEIKFRLNLDSKIHINVLFLKNYRFRLQQEFDNDGQLEELLSRNKLTIKLPIYWKLSPYSSFESFHVFNEKEEVFNFSEYRIGLGAKYKLSKNNSLKVYYIYKGELENNEINSTDIFGIKYEKNL